MNSGQYSVNEALESNKRLKQTGALLLQYKISREMQSLGRSLQIFFFSFWYRKTEPAFTGADISHTKLSERFMVAAEAT